MPESWMLGVVVVRVALVVVVVEVVDVPVVEVVGLAVVVVGTAGGTVEEDLVGRLVKAVLAVVPFPSKRMVLGCLGLGGRQIYVSTTSLLISNNTSSRNADSYRSWWPEMKRGVVEDDQEHGAQAQRHQTPAHRARVTPTTTESVCSRHPDLKNRLGRLESEALYQR